MALAAPAALDDLGPLVLGDHALDLQQQVVLRRPAERAVEEDHLDAGALELVEQQDLIAEAPRQPVGRMDVEALEIARGDRIAQPLQGRAQQDGAAVAVVDEAAGRGDAGRPGRRAPPGRRSGWRWCRPRSAVPRRHVRKWQLRSDDMVYLRAGDGNGPGSPVVSQGPDASDPAGAAPTLGRRNQTRIGLDQSGTAEPGHLTAYRDLQVDWTAFGLRHRRLHGTTVRPWAGVPAPRGGAPRPSQ